MRLLVRLIFLSTLMAGLSANPKPGIADGSPDDTFYGETIYVPAYSHINSHLKLRQPLASTVVIHNVDPTGSITIQSVTYYDREGTLLKSFVTDPVQLAPYASSSFLTEINDNKGGVGANYIVIWTSESPVQSPVSQAVMIGGTGSQGISFLTDGRVIDRQTTPQN